MLAQHLAHGRKVGWRQHPEVFAEVQAHFGLPLRRQPLGRDHQHTPHQPPQLELADDESGFDSLAQAHLVGQQETHAVSPGGTLQGIELMRQWRDIALHRRQQHVFGQCIGDSGCGGQVHQAIGSW